MPSFVLNTNVSKDKIPANLTSELSNLIAKILGKPLSYVVVQIVPDQIMSWGGSTGPCGLAKLMSIGCLGVSENKKYSAAISALLEKSLGIPKDKLYLTFTDAKKEELGYNGTTFHDLL